MPPVASIPFSIQPPGADLEHAPPQKVCGATDRCSEFPLVFIFPAHFFLTPWLFCLRAMARRCYRPVKVHDLRAIFRKSFPFSENRSLGLEPAT
jgi:hypothetical protein